MTVAQGPVRIEWPKEPNGIWKLTWESLTGGSDDEYDAFRVMLNLIDQGSRGTRPKLRIDAARRFEDAMNLTVMDGGSLPVDIFTTIMERQLELQRQSFGIDPQELDGEERNNYVQAMSLAAVIELGEALQEISWKPWASGDYFHREAYLMELIDMLHFWMNLVLIATDKPNDVINVYMRKAQINADRQAVGYTGMEKCETCGR